MSCLRLGHGRGPGVSPPTPAAVDLLCVPLIDIGDGSLTPMFELLPDQRQEFEELAASGTLDTLTVIESPQRQNEPKPDHSDER